MDSETEILKNKSLITQRYECAQNCVNSRTFLTLKLHSGNCLEIQLSIFVVTPCMLLSYSIIIPTTAHI